MRIFKRHTQLSLLVCMLLLFCLSCVGLLKDHDEALLKCFLFSLQDVVFFVNCGIISEALTLALLAFLSLATFFLASHIELDVAIRPLKQL